MPKVLEEGIFTNAAIINTAISQIGIKEIKGEEDNQDILKYFYDLGFDGAKLKDETAWCSAFVNYVALHSGYEHTGRLDARSWLRVGKRLDIRNATVGDIVILWRESPDSWKGHVGIYMNHDKKYVHLLGGNQENQVKVSDYPRTRIIGVRRLNRI